MSKAPPPEASISFRYLTKAQMLALISLEGFADISVTMSSPEFGVSMPPWGPLYSVRLGEQLPASALPVIAEAIRAATP